MCIRDSRKLGLDCLVILGGNGTQKTANLLREEGLNIIHLPKTIDNDIYGTDAVSYTHLDVYKRQIYHFLHMWQEEGNLL